MKTQQREESHGWRGVPGRQQRPDAGGGPAAARRGRPLGQQALPGYGPAQGEPSGGGNQGGLEIFLPPRGKETTKNNNPNLTHLQPKCERFWTLPPDLALLARRTVAVVSHARGSRPVRGSIMVRPHRRRTSNTQAGAEHRGVGRKGEHGRKRRRHRSTLKPKPPFANGPLDGVAQPRHTDSMTPSTRTATPAWPGRQGG